MTVDVLSADATTLDELFMASARAHGARPALWVDGDLLTYADLRAAAMRLGAAISALARARGETGGGRCALLVNRSPTAYAALLGTLLAGLAYVPLNPRFPASRLRAMLDAADARLLIVDRASMDVAQAVLVDYPRPLSVLLPDVPSPPKWALQCRAHGFFCQGDIDGMLVSAAAGHGDGGAYLLFTSGSTGAPKGILIRHGNVLAYLRNALRRYRPASGDRFSQMFDFSFDLSVHDMFLCWSAGACLYCPPASVLAAPRDFIRKHELTFWFSVPSTAAYLSRLRMLLPGDFPGLRVSLFCGEALPTRLAQAWQRAAPHSIVENLYGPTEATIAITAYRLSDLDGVCAEEPPILPIGLPFPDQHVAVIDADGHTVPDGEPGELCLAGSQVADGYWHLPEMTAERFAPPLGLAGDAPRHWYRTGDRVMKRPDCGLVFLGRLDHQAKIRGYRVELQEVETVIRGATGSESVAALLWPPDDVLARHIVAFIAGHRVATGDIIAHCHEKLPPVMVPRQIFFLSEWPLNTNGKTDYAALKRRLQDEPC